MAESLVTEGHALESTTVKIYRTTTVVKGGRRFSFGALVVVGDRKGSVGIGYGKAPGVPAAIEKAQKDARRKMHCMTLQEGTLPHHVTSKYGASLIKLIPAAPGTGVIAGATVRAVLDLAGVRDCLTKSFGSNNHKNLLKATFEGLRQLRLRDEIMDLRGVELEMTDVEKRLEAGRRYMPAPMATEVEKPETRSDGKESRPRGNGKDLKNPSGSHATMPAVAAASETIPAEATTSEPTPGSNASGPGDDPTGGSSEKQE